MADSEEMRQLMSTAAEMLKVERQAMGEHGQVTRRTIAAMAYAQAVLRMVAACMGVEDTPVEHSRREARKAAAEAPRDEHGKFVRRAES